MHGNVQVSLFETEEYKKWHKRWQERLSRQESLEASKQLMRNSNPAIIPRNHRVEEALEAAVEQGDYRVMERLLKALENPYDYSDEHTEYAKLCTSTTPYRTFCGT